MKKSPSRTLKAARRLKKSTGTKFAKSWLDLVKLSQLAMLASGGVVPGGSDSGDDCGYWNNCDDDDCSYGYELGYGPDPVLFNADTDYAYCDFNGWTLCCPCGTYLDTDSWLGKPACCDSYGGAVARVDQIEQCPGTETFGWQWCCPCPTGGYDGVGCVNLGTPHC